MKGLRLEATEHVIDDIQAALKTTFKPSAFILKERSFEK